MKAYAHTHTAGRSLLKVQCQCFKQKEGIKLWRIRNDVRNIRERKTFRDSAELAQLF